MSDDIPDGWINFGPATSVTVDGVEIGPGIASIAPAVEVHQFQAQYRPCPECSHPALVQALDDESPSGFRQIQPDKVTLEWGDDRVSRYVTPHGAGCTAAERADHPEGRWITLPGSTLHVSGFSFGGGQ